MARYKFECQICLEDRDEPRTQVRFIAGSAVCKDCTRDGVVPRFAKALQNELDYPPKYGQEILDIDDFRGLVPVEVQKAWPARIKEYETPVHHRVYCSHLTLAPAAAHGSRRRLEVCGNFLGSTKTSDQFQCPKCKSWSKDHQIHCPCAGSAGQQSSTKKAAFDERTRGSEWQKCPKAACGVVIERSAGCNHMECLHCSTSFCYICGDFASAESDHWFDTCPRFGQPGDRDASYDEDYPSESDEADEYQSESDESDEYSSEPDEAYVLEDDNRDGIGLLSFTWPGRMFFGARFATSGLNASPRQKLQHDLNIAITFNEDFELYIFKPYGRARRVPDSLAPLVNHVTDLMYTMEENLKTALKDMIDDEPTTDVGRDKQAVSFSNFQIGHNRLRHGFVEAYNNLLVLVRWHDNVFFHMFRSIRLYRETLERYMILHAPRFLYNLVMREKDKASHRTSRDDIGRRFSSTSREQRDDDSENEFDCIT
jgi:hypothetical protein